MAAYQKRLLTAENSRLGKLDIVAMLRKDEAWSLLPHETRENLYTLLPPATEAEPPRDLDINPLNIQTLKPYIEEELRKWQNDLTEGREVRKWRVEAMQVCLRRGIYQLENMLTIPGGQRSHRWQVRRVEDHRQR